MSGGSGPQRNQPKLTFKNHSRPLDSISQAYLCAFRAIQNTTNKYL